MLAGFPNTYVACLDTRGNEASFIFVQLWLSNGFDPGHLQGLFVCRCILLMIFCDHVASVNQGQDHARCVLRNQSTVSLPRYLASHIAIGDEITFAVPDGDAVKTEIHVARAKYAFGRDSLYRARILGERHERSNAGGGQ